MRRNKKEKIKKQVKINRDIENDELLRIIEQSSINSSFYFSIKKSSKTNEYLEILASKLKTFHNLQTLYLSLGSTQYYIHQGLEFFMKQLSNISSLRRITIKLQKGLILVKSLQQLKELNELSLFIDFKGYQFHSDYETFNFSDLFSQLQNLNTFDLNILNTEKQVFSQHFQGFQNLIGLKYLSLELNSCSLRDENGFKNLSYQLISLTQIEELNLIIKWEDINQDKHLIKLKDLFRSLKQLRQLKFKLQNFEYYPYKGLEIAKAIKELSNLKTLNFDLRIKTEFKSSLNIIDSITHLQQLENLKLNLYILIDNKDGLDFNLLAQKILKLKNLQKLDLQFSHNNQLKGIQLLLLIQSLKFQFNLTKLLLSIDQLDLDDIEKDFSTQSYHDCVPVFKRLKKINLIISEKESNEWRNKYLTFINQIMKQCTQTEKNLIYLIPKNLLQKIFENKSNDENQNKFISKQIEENEILKCFYQMNSLQFLNFINQSFEIHLSDLVNIFRYLPLLNTLRLNLKSFIFDKIADLDNSNLSLTNLSNLQIQLIDLQSNEILLQLMTFLQQFQNLKSLVLQFGNYISNNALIYDKLGEILSRQKYLKKLTLSLNEKSDFIYLRKLFSVIKQIENLKCLSLDFSEIRFTQDDILFMTDCLQNINRLNYFTFTNNSFNSLYLLNLLNDRNFFYNSYSLYNQFYSYKIITENNPLIQFHKQEKDSGILCNNQSKLISEFSNQFKKISLQIFFDEIEKYQRVQELNWILSQIKTISIFKIFIKAKQLNVQQQDIINIFSNLYLCPNLTELKLFFRDSNQVDSDAIIFLGNQIKELKNIENIAFQFDCLQNQINWSESRIFVTSFYCLTNLKSLQLELHGAETFGIEGIKLFFKTINSLKLLEVLTFIVNVNINLDSLNECLHENFLNLNNLKTLQIGFENIDNQTIENINNFSKNLKILQNLKCFTLLKKGKKMKIKNQVYKLKRLVHYKSRYFFGNNLSFY